MWGIELTVHAAPVAERLLTETGVWIGAHAKVLELAPPLVFTDADVDELLAALDRVLAAGGA